MSALAFLIVLQFTSVLADVCLLKDQYAECDMRQNSIYPSLPNITGIVKLTQLVDMSRCVYGDLMFDVAIYNVPYFNDGPLTTYHGFTAYTSGDMTNGCESMGSHYDPFNTTHGGPNDPINQRHVGDFGNLQRRADGSIIASFSDRIASIAGQYSIVGRGLVLHQDPDDLGRGGEDTSLIDGNAGPKIACCVIRR